MFFVRLGENVPKQYDFASQLVNPPPWRSPPTNKALLRAYSPLVPLDKTLSTSYRGVRCDHFAINFTNSLDKHTTVLQAKKGTKPPWFFWLPPTPIFYDTFVFFCFSIIFLCDLSHPKKIYSKVQTCVATNFQQSPSILTWNQPVLSTVISPGWTTSCPPPRRACGTWISRGIWSDSCSTNRGSLGVVVFWGAKNIGDLLKTCQRFSRVSLPKMFSLRKILKVADFVAYQAATDGT